MSKHYRIAFCGLGSIGKRHFENVQKYMEESNCTCEIDLIRKDLSRNLPMSILAKVRNQYTYDDNTPDDYDIIFVTNPTSMHFDTICQYHQKTKNMFVEKPIFDNIDQVPPITNTLIYVACPMRYTTVLQYIRENVDYISAYSARAISSSYLPDWRPGVDYRAIYSAHKEMGGGVSIDLIHEWDYLTSLFGFPQKVHHAIGTYSNLEINSDDLAVYIGEYSGRVVELHLDYFGRKTERKLELFLPNESVVADFIEKTITFGRAGIVVDLSEERNHYQMNEIRHFFDIVDRKMTNNSTAEDAVHVLKIAAGNDRKESEA